MMAVARALQVLAWLVAFILGSLVAVAGMWIYWVVVWALGPDPEEEY